jgi:2,3-bisphosphoglycerate-independent phosphoglycerate mutase
MLIFADHGNAEDQTPEWRTSHTINPVPLIVVSNDPNLKAAKLKNGKGLKDIAPTVLALMGIEKPKEMTGESIV